MNPWSDRLAALHAVADADGVFQRQDEDLAVADLAFAALAGAGPLTMALMVGWTKLSFTPMSRRTLRIRLTCIGWPRKYSVWPFWRP